MKTATEIIVRYAETDQMGIVHHSVYPIWFEAARTEFGKAIGMSYSDCEKRGLMLPLLSLECNYKKPAYYGETVVIEAWVEKMTPVRMTVAYNVLNKEKRELLATGNTVHAWTNSDRRPVNLKKADPEVYAAYYGSIDK
ncbi:MAG: acyl-CoA thioesterase [Clostridia bacterium]|nr:acyl-CoA thioesterase [Clostridia bacterium]